MAAITKALGLLIAVAALGLGGYLLAWATQWPHADMREQGATAVGATSVIVGLAAAVAVLTAARATWRVVVIIGAAAAVLAGLLALATVTRGQVAACGDALAACNRPAHNFGVTAHNAAR